MSEASGNEIQAFAVDDASRRRHRRWFVDFKSTVTLGTNPLNCAVYDLSPGGACIEVLDPAVVVVGDRLDFELPGYGAIPAEVRYYRDGYFGLMFLHELEGEMALARYLVSIEQNRRPEQCDVKLETKLWASGIDQTCVLDDISRHGAKVLLEETRHIVTGQEVGLEVPGLGRIDAAVAHVEANEVGLAFLRELELVPDGLAQETDAVG